MIFFVIVLGILYGIPLFVIFGGKFAAAVISILCGDKYGLYESNLCEKKGMQSFYKVIEADKLPRRKWENQ